MKCQHFKVKIGENAPPYQVKLMTVNLKPLEEQVKAIQGIVEDLQNKPHLSVEDVQAMIDKIDVPNVDLSAIQADIDALKTKVATMGSMVWTENEIKNMITSQFVSVLFPIRADIRDLQTSVSKIDDLEMRLDEIEENQMSYSTVNTLINNRTANLLTAEQAQSLIDTSINRITDGEGVRY